MFYIFIWNQTFFLLLKPLMIQEKWDKLFSSSYSSMVSNPLFTTMMKNELWQRGLTSVKRWGGSTIQRDWILYQISGSELGGLHYTRDALYTRSYGIFSECLSRVWSRQKSLVSSPVPGHKPKDIVGYPTRTCHSMWPLPADAQQSPPFSDTPSLPRWTTCSRQWMMGQNCHSQFLDVFRGDLSSEFHKHGHQYWNNPSELRSSEMPSEEPAGTDTGWQKHSATVMTTQLQAANDFRPCGQTPVINSEWQKSRATPQSQQEQTDVRNACTGTCRYRHWVTCGWGTVCCISVSLWDASSSSLTNLSYFIFPRLILQVSGFNYRLLHPDGGGQGMKESA